MKKLLLFLICLVLIQTALAQIDISLVSYDSESHNAKIMLKNTGNESYHDIALAVDDQAPRTFTGSLFSPGTAVQIPRIIPPGKHVITVTTAEDYSITKELNFAKSTEQIQKEQEQQEEILAEQQEKQKELLEKGITLTDIEEPKEKSNLNVVLTTVLVIVLIALIIYSLTKKKRISIPKRIKKINSLINKIRQSIKQNNIKSAKLSLEKAKKHLSLIENIPIKKTLTKKLSYLDLLMSQKPKQETKKQETIKPLKKSSSLESISKLKKISKTRKEDVFSKLQKIKNK